MEMGCRRFLLLHGSETGQSQAIAEEIHELAPKHDLQSDLFCLSLTEKKFSLANETCMVMVVSTTGEGECPEKASKFWRRLRKKTLPPDHLAHLNYAILALGDSNYSNFCRNGKNFDERLQELGAKKFYPTGHADDAVGLEVVVEPWIEGLWKEIHRILKTETDKTTDDATTGLQNGCAAADKHDQRPDKSRTTIDRAEENHEDSSSSTHNEMNVDHSAEHTLQEKGTPSLTASTKDVPDKTPSQIERSTTQGVDANAKGKVLPNQESTDVLNSHQISEEKQEVNGEETMEGPVVASLRTSVPPLSESGLTMPLLPPPFLQVDFVPNEAEELNVDELPLQGGAPMPSSSSGIIQASIVKATRLTRDNAVKTAMDIELKVPADSLTFQPGDSFSIVCPNNPTEVNALLDRLGVSQSDVDTPVRISVIKGTTKKRAAIPDFMSSLSTLCHLLMTCCDIRAVPKKAFLRTLVEYTSNPGEKRRIQELCSKQGQADYAAFIRGPGLSLTDILHAFPSCRPPIQRVLEHVTRLQPRPYSIASSPLTSPDSFHIVFNMIDIPAGEGRSQSRQGVCTGWLSHLAQKDESGNGPVITDVQEKFEKMSVAESGLTEQVRIPIFARTNQRFHLPSDCDASRPLILIGPGTGVAPFIGFLEHRNHMMKTAANQVTGEGLSRTYGPVWLFFGCRHKDRDYLYREKLEGFLETGVLSRLCVSFSRDQHEGEGGEGEPAPRYVQDNMRLCSNELADMVLDQHAHVYVCGDAKNMAKNVLDTWKDILKEKTGQGDFEMLQLIARLREERRYLEDVWT